jgi:hypothetical protein
MRLIRTPYLIQRATIKTPLAEGTSRLSDAVSFDYMGSSEFEWGALPKSLRALQFDQKILKFVKVPEIMEGEQQLRVLHAFESDEDFAKYKEYLLRLRGVGEHMRLKERSEFDLTLKSRYDRANFWWDIDNHVMFSFHKIFMNRLQEHLASSWKYMDEQKKA